MYLVTHVLFMSFITDAKTNFEKVVEHLRHELSAVRTGRATPAIAEDIQVEAYGTMQPIRALASISTPDSRTVQIEPWDATVVKAIETALMKSDLGMMPTVDGKTIRLNMPMMTEETRKDMVKKMKVKLEDAKISLRKIREENKKAIEAQESVGLDMITRELADLERMVKEYTAKIDELGAKKEQEVMTV